MTTLTRKTGWTRPRIFALLATAGVLFVFFGANAHFITMAFMSRPDCVLAPQTEGAVVYRAAKTSC